jgi:FKBP-type peptidyl-prolyl cis-trans isomerase FklB
MKLKLSVLALTSLCFSTTFAADAPKPEVSSEMQQVSYSIGVDLGRNMKKQGFDMNVASLSKGIQDGFSGQQTLLTDEKMKEVLMKFQKDFVAKKNAELAQLGQTNLEKGQKFLADNKSKPGVVTLASGLQYKIISPGTGQKPVATDSVTVDYTGRLIDGKVFDSSEKQGKPITFKVDQVIPGWTEVLQLMPVGSTWEVYIPANLAYGAQAVGPMIGPNETLVFNIHLISVQKA